MTPLKQIGLAAIATLATSLMPIGRPALANTFGQQEVNASRFVVMASPYGDNLHQLAILEQISNARSCWREYGSNPVQIEPLLLNFDFTGICGRSIDSNGYSIRVGGEELGWRYSLQVVRRGNDLILIGRSNVDPKAPELEIARTSGPTQGFSKLVLQPGWRLTKRTYQGKALGHVYLTHDRTLAELSASPGTPAATTQPAPASAAPIPIPVPAPQPTTSPNQSSRRNPRPSPRLSRSQAATETDNTTATAESETEDPTIARRYPKLNSRLARDRTDRTPNDNPSSPSTQRNVSRDRTYTRSSVTVPTTRSSPVPTTRSRQRQVDSIPIPVPPPERPTVQRSRPTLTSSTQLPPPPTSNRATRSTNVLPVPGNSTPPLGNIGSYRLPPSPNSSGSFRGSPSAPSSLAETLGFSYRVVVQARNPQAQNKVRSLVPDAFRIQWNGRTMMQAGLFEDRETADAMQAFLNSHSLRATVVPVQ